MSDAAEGPQNGTAARSERRGVMRPFSRGIGFGTPVMTAEGWIPVEFLTDGDYLMTPGGPVRLVALKTTLLTCVRPCRVGPSSLGHARPESALVLAPDTAVVLRDWRAPALYGTRAAAVPVTRLVDGTHIRRDANPMAMRVVEPLLEKSCVIDVDGLEVMASGADVPA